MERRWRGVLVLVVALVGVLAVSGLTVERLGGTAVAVVIPAPPIVGDCLVERPARVVHYPVDSPVQWDIGRCVTTRYGEVSAVITTPDDLSSWPHAAEAPEGIGSIPNYSCGRAAEDYVGVGSVPAGSVLQWTLAVRVFSVIIGPTPRQQADGQHWQACVVYLQVRTGGTVVVPQIVGYFQNAVHTGVMSDEMGFCTSLRATGVPNFEAGSCTEPHAVQIMASGFVGDLPIARVDAVADCRRIVERLTNRPGITADPALDVRIVFVRSGVGVVDADEIPAGTGAVCIVGTADDRLLRGSLLGLGAQPIPWV